MTLTHLAAPRNDWTVEQATDLLQLPFNDLLFQAHSIHRREFDPNEVQISTLLSIKTGACAEDCSYCPQSARYDTGLERESLMPVDEVLTAAREARDRGASFRCLRFQPWFLQGIVRCQPDG